MFVDPRGGRIPAFGAQTPESCPQKECPPNGGNSEYGIARGHAEKAADIGDLFGPLEGRDVSYLTNWKMLKIGR